MDTADAEIQQTIEDVLDRETARHGIEYHRVRHRDIGDGHWVELHLLFPDTMTVRQAHRIATEIERAVESSLKPSAHVTTHLEPQHDHSRIHRDDAD